MNVVSKFTLAGLILLAAGLGMLALYFFLHAGDSSFRKRARKIEAIVINKKIVRARGNVRFLEYSFTWDGKAYNGREAVTVPLFSRYEKKDSIPVLVDPKNPANHKIALEGVISAGRLFILVSALLGLFLAALFLSFRFLSKHF
jgi:hypothetical protein